MTGFLVVAGCVSVVKGASQSRKRREIISDPKMEDMSEEQALIDLSFDRFVRKAGLGRYDKDTAILIYVNTHRTLGVDWRTELVTRKI